MLNRTVVRWIPLIVAVFVAGSAAHAQTGRIAGVVTDSAGRRPLEGAAISAVGDGNRTLASTRTDAAGRFTLGAVPPGNVQVHVRMLGYGTQDRTISLAAGQTATENFSLSQRSVTLDQVVVVAPAAPLRDALSATSSRRSM